MTTALHQPTQGELAGIDLAGIFPSYDPETDETSRREPMKPSRAAAAEAAERESAELRRIARAEESWRQQVAIDQVDEASMESFPCSDPPAYYTTHA